MSENPTVVVPQLCQKHQRALIQRLMIPESGPWRVAIITAQIMMFQAAVANDVVWQRCSALADGQPNSEDLSLVLAEIGCLACFEREGWLRVLRIMGTKGIRYAAQVAQKQIEDADWPYLTPKAKPDAE